MFNRRQLLLGAVGGILGGPAVVRRSTAQPDVLRLDDRDGGRLSLLTAAGTNVMALATADGLVLVDSGTPELTGPLTASLQQLVPGGRVATVFNTHFHLDHTGANEVLGQGGATIVAHENTRLWMATPVWAPGEDRYRPPRPEAARPTETFYVDGSTTAGGQRIDYGYLIEAHTSGDIYVGFRESNVLAVGDVASPVRDPALDFLTGAWIGGRLDALDRLLALSDDETRIVPGSGPVMRRADLQAERDMMATIYERTVDRVREGDSAEDMLEAGVLDGLPRTWDDPYTFVHAVHKGLWAHHNKLAPNIV